MSLKDCSLKQTKVRKKILQILEQARFPLTAEEIYKLDLVKDVNLSTIYRNLNTFYEHNIIEKEIRNDGRAVFSLIKDDHVHVLICSKCHKKIYLRRCPFETIKNEILLETGFLVQNHNIELHGICKNCQNKV